jgi:tetratricopeptide (TPR) repeat protein
MSGIVRLRLCTSFLLTTAAALVTVQSATGQMNPTPQPEKVSNRALQLAAEGKLSEADKALEEALRQCQRAGALPNCAAMLSFTRAYLAQQRGRAGIDDARTFYRNVLATQPSNGAALNNLALVEDSAGNSVEAERLWQQAIQNDPGHAGHYALLLGDHYLRLKNITAALDSYEQAGQATPEAVAPRRRIVEAYREMPGTAGLEALESRAEQWERLDPENSRAAYELLLGRWSSGSQSVSAAERSLVRWAALLARNDWLDVGSLGSLPSSWEHPGVHELRDYERDPLSPPRWNWWRGDPDRLGVTFEIARATGRRLLRSAENGPTKAERCWQSALRTVPTDFLAEFPSAVNGYLRVSQELASLYFERPSLDADNTRMGEIVRHLYEGKMAAIGRGDWRVTQAFHTTLALIYVARGNWEAAPGTPGYMSAVYQLQAVLDDAGRREKSEHFFQPLPEIKGMLAKTLTRIPKRKNEAGPMYFRAALAYLDADSLRDAREMLKAHRELGPPDAAAEQFEQILATRTNPGGLSLAALNSASAPWLFRASGPLDESFLGRERFKIYADLAGGSSAEPAQLEAALDAYGLAAEQRTNLVGGGDLLRWQHVEATLLASANAQAAPADSPAAKWSVAAPSETSLRITLAGEDRPVPIFLRKETPVAAQVIRAVGVTNMRDVKPYLRLRPEGIEIAPAPAGSDLAPLLDRIKRTPNIPLARKPAIVTPQ